MLIGRPTILRRANDITHSGRRYQYCNAPTGVTIPPGRTGTAGAVHAGTDDRRYKDGVYVFIWRDTLQHFNVVDTCR